MALGQTAGCPRVNRAKKFMCSPRNTGNINFSLWLTGGLSQGCPDFQKVYVFKVYVPFSCPKSVADMKRLCAHLHEKCAQKCFSASGPECTAVAAIWLRMRIRILTRPEHSTKSQTKSCELSVAKELLAKANGFANDIAKISSSLWNFIANGSLRQNSLAIAHVMAGALR